MSRYETPLDAVKRVVKAFAANRRLGGMVPIKDVRRVLPHLKCSAVNAAILEGFDTRLWDLGQVNPVRFYREEGRDAGLEVPRRKTHEYDSDVDVFGWVVP